VGYFALKLVIGLLQFCLRTAQCYVDTNVNGIPDQVQELHQESGEYVADGAAHDPDVSDIWDTILSFFA